MSHKRSTYCPSHKFDFLAVVAPATFRWVLIVRCDFFFNVTRTLPSPSSFWAHFLSIGWLLSDFLLRDELRDKGSIEYFLGFHCSCDVGLLDWSVEHSPRPTNLIFLAVVVPASFRWVEWSLRFLLQRKPSNNFDFFGCRRPSFLSMGWLFVAISSTT